MKISVFVVYTVFGSSTLAFVQHSVVQPNSVVSCNQFDTSKNCAESKLLSAHSNKSATPSNNAVKKAVQMRPAPRRLPQRGMPRLRMGGRRRMVHHTVDHSRRSNGQHFPKLKAMDNGDDDDGDDSDDDENDSVDVDSGSSEADANTYYDDNDDNDIEDYDEYEIVNETDDSDDVKRNKGDEILSDYVADDDNHYTKSSSEAGSNPIRRRKGRKIERRKKTKDNKAGKSNEAGDKQEMAAYIHKGRKSNKTSERGIKKAKSNVGNGRKLTKKKTNKQNSEVLQNNKQSKLTNKRNTKVLQNNKQSKIQKKQTNGLKVKNLASVEMSTMSLVERAYRRAMSFTTPKESVEESDVLPSDYQESASSYGQKQIKSGSLAGRFSQLPVRQTFKRVASMVGKYGDLLLDGMNIVDFVQNMEFPFSMMIPRRIIKALPTVLKSREMNILKKVIPICVKNKVIQAIKSIPVSAIRKFPIRAIKRIPIRAVKKLPIRAVEKIPIRVVKSIPFHAIKQFPISAVKQLPASVLSYTAQRKAA